MNFTDTQLIELTNPLNHKIIKLKSGDYSWKFKENEVWTDRYFTTFENYDKPSHFLHYSLAVWNEELKDRRDKEAKRLKKGYRKLNRIKRDLEKSNTEKIRQVIALNLNLTHEDIANELGISTKTIQRALKDTVINTEEITRKPKKRDSKLYYNENDPIEVRTQSKEYKDYVANMFNKK